jgi:hypothetical protein
MHLPAADPAPSGGAPSINTPDVNIELNHANAGLYEQSRSL